MKESPIEKAAAEWAKQNGWVSYKFASPNKRSVPDRVFIKNGVHVFIEFKKPGEKPSTSQLREQGIMKRHGAVVFNADNFSQVVTILETVSV